MDLLSTQEFDSTTLPGVKYVLRRLTDAQRNGIRGEHIDHFDALEEIAIERGELQEELTATEDAAGKKSIRAKMRLLNRQYERITTENIDKAYVRHCLVSTTLTYDGAPVTADNISAASPSRFAEEVWDKIRSFSIYGAVEAKNSELPTTSNDPAQ